MGAKRCSICALNWPSHHDYSTCASCGGHTSYVGNEDPMTDDEAKFKKKEIEFEERYKQRGEREPTGKEAAEAARAIEKAERQQAELLALRAIPTLDEDPTPDRRTQ